MCHNCVLVLYVGLKYRKTVRCLSRGCPFMSWPPGMPWPMSSTGLSLPGIFHWLSTSRYLSGGCPFRSWPPGLPWPMSSTALCKKPLKKWHLEFAGPSGDYSTLLCLSLLFLIYNPLILQNTFWSYKILVSFRNIF